MTKVYQTTRGPIPADENAPMPGQVGNCWAACLATILQKPLEDIPQPVAGVTWAEYETAVRAYLLRLGLFTMSLNISLEGEILKQVPAGSMLMYVGYTKNRGLHACIYRDARLWHDPSGANSPLVETVGVEVLAVNILEQ